MIRNLSVIWLPFLLFQCLYAFAQSDRYTDSLLEVIETAANDTLKTDLLNELAWRNRNSDLKKAEEFSARSLDIARKCNYKRGMVQSYNNLGNMHFIKGNYPEALQNYLSSLKIMEALDDKAGIANCLMGVGNVYYVQRDYDLALRYQILSLNSREELGDSSGAASCYNNIGAIYLEKGNADSSLLNYQKSLEIRLKLNDIPGMSSCYGNIGNIFEMQGKNDLALEYQLKALDIRKTVGNKKGMVMSYNDISRIYLVRKLYRNALDYQLKSLNLALEIGFGEGIIRGYQAVSKTYELMGNKDKALEYYKKHSAVKDSVFSSEKSFQIAEMQTRFETEKKEKEIEILKRDKEIQQLIVSGQQSELRKQRFVILFIAAALVLLGALAILLFSMNRFKKRANRELSLRNKEILQQKEVIARKNRDITDSLEYARTIQESALTPMEQIREILGEFFIVYKPKDIVSGDFYWAALPGQGKFAWAAADCTGHGVPGALMSILGISLLNEIVIEKKTEAPDLVLNELRLGVVKCLGQLSDRNIQKDGIDIVLCVFDRAKMTISFAGANTPLLHISKNNAVLYKGDKQPAGYYTGELRPFTRVDIPVCNGDMIYAFSDGFQDQFGGADGEKYRYNNLKQLLQEIHELSMEEQRTVLESRFSEWISHTDPRTGEKFEQIDDVLIFGVRI